MHLRIQPCLVFTHVCHVCGAEAECHHRDLDFRGAVVCDDCAPLVVCAEVNLYHAGCIAPVDRALHPL